MAQAQGRDQDKASAGLAQPTEKKRGKFYTKAVKFGSKEMTLYSLDGVTWSSRRDELQVIQERHEAERQKLLANMGEVKAEEERESAGESKKEKESEKEEGTPLIMDDVDVEVSDEDETETKKTGARAARPIKELPKRPEAKSEGKEAGKSKKKPVSARDRVQFVAPKPRQLEKARKAAKAKKKKAA